MVPQQPQILRISQADTIGKGLTVRTESVLKVLDFTWVKVFRIGSGVLPFLLHQGQKYFPETPEEPLDFGDNPKDIILAPGINLGEKKNNRLRGG